jgi:hypothetical protein
VRGLEVGIVAIGRHGGVSFVGSAAPIAAFTTITRRRAVRACTAERSDSGRSAAEDGGPRLFCFAMQSREIAVPARHAAWGANPGGRK